MKEFVKKNTKYIALYVGALILIYALIHLDAVNLWLGDVLTLFRPIIIGLVLAYLCNPFFRLFENKVFSKFSSRTLRRTLSLFLTYLVVFLLVAALLLLIVPQLIDSILTFLDSYESYLDTSIAGINGVSAWINGLLESGNVAFRIPALEADGIKTAINGFLQSIKFDPQSLLDLITPEGILIFFDTVGSAFSMMADIVFGIFISLYLLATKEKRYAQVMRLRRALFGDRFNATLTHICTIADRSFGNYMRGKLLDSLLVAIVVYILISIFGMPYAVLIATIIGITDIIPVIGPFIGVIPSAVIILLTDPPKIIPFLLIILVVQQLDGNVMAPKILGENTGVSTLAVLVSITLMGSIWGLFGMVLGVPIVATVIELFNPILKSRLAARGIREEEEASAPKKPPKRRLFGRKPLREGAAEEGLGDLTYYEKHQLDIYALARKHGIFSEDSEAALSRFAAEEALLIKAGELHRAHRTEKTEQPASTAEDAAEQLTQE